MKLKEVRIVNFRQFYGEHKLKFGIDSKNNVTVVHGENGSGKTALLNAFKWAFYGTTDFNTGVEHIVSERAVAEANTGDSIDIFVNVKFEHDGEEFHIQRHARSLVEDAETCNLVGKSQLEMTYTGNDGANRRSPNPQSHINQILPERMHPYFFFNGERIEKLASIEASQDIRTAIKAIMGLEVLERAAIHLESGVVKSLKQALKSHSTKDLSDVLERETKIIEEKEILEEEIQANDKNKRHFRANLTEIKNRLTEIGPISDLQKERDLAEEELIRISNDIAETRKRRNTYISENGFLAFSGSFCKKAQGILEERRRKGELPGKIKSQFIKDLLEAEVCICGRELEVGTDSHRMVQEFRKTTVPNDVEDAFMSTSASIKSMTARTTSMRAELNRFAIQLNALNEERIHKRGRIDEITSRIGKAGLEDVEKLEGKREQYLDKISECDQKMGRFKELLQNTASELEKVVGQRRELEKKGSGQKAASRKLELAEESLRLLKALYESLSESVRTELSIIVNETFRHIIKKEYWAEISEDYTLSIRKKVGDHEQEVIDKSTGESQVSSLSFIGGLIALAKKRHRLSSAYYKGGIFPIVMDSPYGNLDPEYREKVADALPTLADQVIIMVSNSQWKPEVERAVGTRVGAEYTLMYHTPHKKADVKTSSVIEGEDYEFTEIREGYYE